MLAQNLRPWRSTYRRRRAERGARRGAHRVWRTIGHGRSGCARAAQDAAATRRRGSTARPDDGRPAGRRRAGARAVPAHRGGRGAGLHPAQWRLLRAAVPHARDDLFIVGDPHQRIFDTRVTLGSVGIHAMQHALRGLLPAAAGDPHLGGTAARRRAGRRAGQGRAGDVRLPAARSTGSGRSCGPTSRRRRSWRAGRTGRRLAGGRRARGSDRGGGADRRPGARGPAACAGTGRVRVSTLQNEGAGVPAGRA